MSTRVSVPLPKPLPLTARADTPQTLRSFQRTLLTAVIRPLTAADRTQAHWIDGRPMAEFAAEYIKPNDRLTALERLQIYNRMYWYRLLDCFHDDNPGLRALLGAKQFVRLAEAYLTRHPSSSYTLRNLCRQLADFVRAEPRWTAPHTRLAWEIARFEWAQTVAFDEPARPVPEATDLNRPAGRLRLALQPYLTLLALDHPVDDYVIAVKQRESLRAAASQAAVERRASATRRVPRPPRQRVYLAVHRCDGRLYYKRLHAPAFRVLSALRDGRSLADAVAVAGARVKPDEVRAWFATWMQLGWFCRRARTVRGERG